MGLKQLHGTFNDICISFCIIYQIRFVQEAKPLLDSLEDCFMALAECQHLLEANGLDDS